MESWVQGSASDPHATPFLSQYRALQAQEDVGTHLGRILGVGGSVGAPRGWAGGVRPWCTPHYHTCSLHTVIISMLLSVSTMPQFGKLVTYSPQLQVTRKLRNRVGWNLAEKRKRPSFLKRRVLMSITEGPSGYEQKTPGGRVEVAEEGRVSRLWTPGTSRAFSWLPLCSPFPSHSLASPRGTWEDLAGRINYGVLFSL